MTAVAKFVTDAKDLIEKVFLKTSFLIVLVSLFLFSQWVVNPIKYLPFIKHFQTQNLYTTYAVTIAMLLLLSRVLSVIFDWVNHKLHITEKWVLWKKEQDKNARTKNAKKIEDIRDTHEADQYIVNILLQSKSAYNFFELLNKEGIKVSGVTHNKKSKVLELSFSMRTNKEVMNAIHVKTKKEVTSNITYDVFYAEKLRLEAGISCDEILAAYKDHQEELTFAQL